MAAAVIGQLTGTHQRIVVVTLALGLRVSQALGIEWDCVDVADAPIRVHQQLRRDGRWHLEPTKSRDDTWLGLPQVAAAALREQRAAQATERLAAGPLWNDQDVPGDLVFRRADGQPVHASTITRAVKRACRAAGVPVMSIHPFARHGHATLLRLAGATMDDIREQLRHRQASTTTRYAHVVPEMRRRNAGLIDDLLR